MKSKLYCEKCMNIMIILKMFEDKPEGITKSSMIFHTGKTDRTVARYLEAIRKHHTIVVNRPINQPPIFKLEVSE